MIFDDSYLLIVALFIPVICASLIFAFGKYPNIREGISILSGAALIYVVCSIAGIHDESTTLRAQLWEILPGIKIALHSESLSIIYALVASVLWPVTIIYATGYMRGNKEKNQPRFYIFFAISIACAMGIAFAANLITFFLFYELMTLCTYPLVAHNETAAARAGARKYLSTLMLGSIGLLLPAIAITYAITGSLDFTQGGVFESDTNKTTIIVLLLLFTFGIAKAGIMPLHKWLPSAMVAPTPVSALLHAVAVVKAGVFGIAKILVYVFGFDSLQNLGQGWFSSQLVLYIACFTIITASVIALFQTNLKRIMAYSTIGQLSYIVLSVALLNQAGVFGAGLQITTHALAKITLFFVVGAVYVCTRRTELKQVNGLGRKYPVLFGCYVIACLSMVALPFLAGYYSKGYISTAYGAASSDVAKYVLLVSLVLNCLYLFPIAIRAYFYKFVGDKVRKTADFKTSPMMLGAVILTTSLIITYGLYYESLVNILSLIYL